MFADAWRNLAEVDFTSAFYGDSEVAEADATARSSSNQFEIVVGPAAAA